MWAIPEVRPEAKLAPRIMILVEYPAISMVSSCNKSLLNVHSVAKRAKLLFNVTFSWFVVAFW